MSTLDINNYSNHRPMTMIYQNLDIVSEGTADRTAAVLIGSRGTLTYNKPSASTDAEKEKQRVEENPALFDSSGNIKKQELILIRSTSDVYKYLCNSNTSVAITSNDLAKAALFALTANGGDPFYCIPTDTYTYIEESDAAPKTESWDSAIKVLKNNDRTMFVCPITDDTNDIAKVIQACVECSKPDTQKWKRCYVGVESNSESNPPVDADSIESWINTIKIDNATLSYEAKQRTCFVWAPEAKCATTSEDGQIKEETISNTKIAAGITALRASILPQQGLSRRTLPWIYKVPGAYASYDEDALNKIAVNGVFIVTQDDPDSEVYIRHQLTNDLSRGILYYEDSVGVNVDTICYGLKDIVKGYVGQRNNTNETLLEIKNRVADYLLSLTSTGVSIDARRIGPQITQVDLDSLIVKLDDNFKDRVLISVDIVVPVPLNQIRVHLNAFVSMANVN